MKILITLVVVLCGINSFAQQQSFDLTSFTAPQGWKKETKENIVAYTITDKKKNTWCQIQVVKSTISQGGIDEDFASEWQHLIVANYPVKDTPNIYEVQEAEGWKVKGGGGKFTFNNKDAMAMLTTMSGYNRCVSIITLTNTQDYVAQIESFMASVSFSKPNTAADNTAGTTTIATATDVPDQTAAPAGFAFSTTNFDDGWTSVVKEDWVEVSKGNIKVLLHYPKAGTIFPADPEPMTNAAWNILVAPRYSNLKNYKTAYVEDFNRPYFGMGYADEIKTGKNVFIVFFRRGGDWIEVVSPDKNSFTQEFGFDATSIRWGAISQYMGGWVVDNSQGNTVNADHGIFDKLDNMANRNKFAVAPGDFKGKWTSDYTGVQQLYNVYTGNYAGMNMNQSNEEFVFGAQSTYNWKFLAVNGMVGNAKVSQAKSSGNLTVPNNWQVHFTMIETRARTYHAHWSCMKGARILNLLDADFPGSGIYTKYGLAK
jgi:hypothetical protein